MGKKQAAAMLGFLAGSMATLNVAAPNLGWFLGNRYGNANMGFVAGAMGGIVANSIGYFSYGAHSIGIRIAVFFGAAL